MTGERFSTSYEAPNQQNSNNTDSSPYPPFDPVKAEALLPGESRDASVSNPNNPWSDFGAPDITNSDDHPKNPDTQAQSLQSAHGDLAFTLATKLPEGAVATKRRTGIINEIKRFTRGVAEKIPGTRANYWRTHDDLVFEATADLLTNAGFDRRHAAAIDSSLRIAQDNKGEHGNLPQNATDRVDAYLRYLHETMDQDADVAQDARWRFLQDSADRLIVQPEDISDSYWAAYENSHAENGQVAKLSDQEKEQLVKDAEQQQSESLKPWLDYFSQDGRHLPAWFMVYALDGVSKMGAFDKGQRSYHQRDGAPLDRFPRLDARALRKTYAAIVKFYGLNWGFAGKPEKRGADADLNPNLKELISSGDFSQLYANFRLEEPYLAKTPERPEDVRGVWREYTQANLDDLWRSTKDTQWEVHTLENHPDYAAKFIQFHLQDPETDMVAENACASIQIDDWGRISRIFGLDEGKRQALEPALIPVVREKVRTLPGNEQFLKGLDDRQHLLAMCRKMEAGEYDFTQEDLDFIFEQDYQKIETLENCRTQTPGMELEARYHPEYQLTLTRSPHITELKAYILQDPDFATRFPNGLEIRSDLTFDDLDDADLEYLPEGVKIDGSFILGFSHIKSLPRGLHIGKDFTVHGTPLGAKPLELPEDLFVGGNLTFHREGATRLPQKFEVGGSVDLSFTAISELPENWHVKGDLALSRNESIAQLPKGLRVDGGLIIDKTKIEALPDDLQVGKSQSIGEPSFYLRETNGLAIPETIDVIEGSVVGNYSDIKLHEGLHICGDLNLFRWRGDRLPDDLRIDGKLDLTGSRDITELPKGLVVGGYLVLHDTNIAELPADLQVGGKILGGFAVERASQTDEPTN